jgi:hypothetical protein
MGLILSVKPGLTQAEARKIMESTCDKTGGYNYATNAANPNGTWSNELGHGRINASAAITKALFTPVTAGPFVATVTQPAVNCYSSGNPATSVYFDINISGGTPYLEQWNSSTGTGYKYFQLDYVTDTTVAFSDYGRLGTPNITNVSGHPNSLYFPQNTIGTPSGVKRVYLTFGQGSVFPFQTDFYIRVTGLVNNTPVIRHIPVHLDAFYSPDFTMAPQVNRCNLGYLYTANAVTGVMTPTGSTYSWALGNYPNTAATIDYTADPKYPSIYVLTHDETITLSVTSPAGCTTSKSTLVKVGNLQVSPAPATKLICTSSLLTQIGPSQVTGGIGNITYQWNSAPGLSNTNVRNAVVNASIAGTGLHTYTLVVTDSYGCTKTFNYSVDIQAPVSTVNLTANYNNGCPGHDVTITGNINGPYGIYYDINYFSGTDSLQTILVTPTLSKTMVNPYASTSYLFKAKDPYGCLVTGTIPITVQTNYTLAANAGADTYSCAPDPKTITGTASGGTPPYDYFWEEPVVYNQTLTLPNATKTYTLVVKDSNGCRAKDQVVITSSPLLNPGWANPIILVPQGAVVTQGMGPGYADYHVASGGTPPYTYLWTPSSLFVDPTVYNPTTQPLYECFAAANTVTDSRGCTATRPCALYINVAGERSEPFGLIPNSDVCNGKTLEISNQTGGLGFIGGNYANVVENGMYNNIYYTNACQYWTGQPSAVTSYSFNPSPISQSGNEYSFAPNTTNVTITANQTLSVTNSLQPLYRTYTVNYTFPQKDNSRNNLVYVGGAIIYVGSDQLLHKLVWESIGNSWRWNHYLITPQNGWGNKRVEGWLAVNAANTKVYFKGTDQKMYQMILPLSASPIVQQLNLPIGLNVKSDIICRQDGVFFIGDDNFIHRFNPTTNAYDAMLPPSAYGGLTVLGHLAAAAYPQTHLAFLCSDNKVRDFYETSGVWQIGAVSGTTSTGETMIDPQNGDVYYKTTANKIETLPWNNTTKMYGNPVLISAANDPNYAVDGYMVKDPSLNRIFYKDMDGRISNIFESGGLWYAIPFDVNMTDVAGDIRLVSQDRFFYINNDKSVHEVTYTQTGWYDRGVAPALPKNVKACSYNYKSLLQDGAEFSDVSESVFKVYPNPANTQLTIEHLTEMPGNYKLSLTDVTSRTVQEFSMDLNQDRFEIDLKHHVEGVYFVNLFRDGVLIENKKIIIQH